MSAQDRLLDVPGARLFYRTRGAGPVLLVLQGGAADADGSDALAAELEDRFTVVSYDRRGLSRSVLDAQPARPTLDVHAEDAARLLDAVSPGAPAALVGVSIGALIGLEVAARHPDRVLRLVAYEPPASQVLPEARRAELVGLQTALEESHRREGAFAAMRRFMAGLGVDPYDREAGAEVRGPSPYLGANFEFFLAHDAPAVRAHRLDLDALRAVAAKVVVGVGKNSRGTLHGEPALALERELGLELAEFPGGHGAYASHPRAFAAKLREVFGRR